MRPAIVAILSLFLAVPLAAGQGTITTVAGTGVPGFSGDGGPATSAKLNYPHGLAVDSAGNLYVADYNNMRVRKVSPAGIITTVAGNGIGDFTGENGHATSESLWWPIAVTVDSAGNLYIADEKNERVRKVSPSGWMTTVAGGGECCALRDGGPATRANLQSPRGLAVDASGNLYISVTHQFRVRRVNPHGEITTFAGYGGAVVGNSGDGGLAKYAAIGYGPLTLDTAGNLYISGSRVRKISPSGTITTVAGGGSAFYTVDGVPATSLRLDVLDVASDGGGNLYLATYERVLKVGPSGLVRSVAGGGTNEGDGIPSTQARLTIGGIAMDRAGNLYLADVEKHRIRKITQ